MIQLPIKLHPQPWNDSPSEGKQLCVLHVGMPKTGSSSIQSTLFFGLDNTSHRYIGFGEINGSRALKTLVGENPEKFFIHRLLNFDKKVTERLKARLHIYDSTFGSPISENHWRRISNQEKSGVIVHGAYQNEKIGEILAGLDAVIVPSVWFENSPLTIQEAFIGGVPVITSNQGGMAELVRDGVDGLHFRLGDANDLRNKLVSLIEDPNQLNRLRSEISEVPSIEQQTAVIRQYYEQLI